MAIDDIVEDWPMVKRRWAAWWDRQIIDRPVICITAPREGATPVDELQEAKRDADPRAFWTDIDGMIRRAHERFSPAGTTWLGGEALPIWGHGWSVGHALTFGCRPAFSKWSVWTEPAPVEADGYPRLDGWRTSPWWKWMRDGVRQAARESRGEYFVQVFWGNHAGDTLGMMRHSDQLMIDLVENPSWVSRAVKTISEALLEQWTTLTEIIHREGANLEGSVDYCGCWSPTPSMGFDTDISCMISPGQFREIFLPPLVETMRTVDHRIYHLDGAVALHHLPALLELPELQAIQWLPGAGRTAIMQWVPVIQRMQAARKSVQVLVSPGEVLPLLRAVRPEGLCMVVSCESQKQGRELLRQVR